MKRREFFEKAGIGSAALALPALTTPASKGKGADAGRLEQEHGHDGKHDDMEGPLSSATVSFGQWDLDPPFDRFPNNSDRTRNNHQLIPGVVDIKVGGCVNFIISGFHHILIYDDGTKPADINIRRDDSDDGAARAAAHQRSGQADLPRPRSERVAHAAGQHAAATDAGSR